MPDSSRRQGESGYVLRTGWSSPRSFARMGHAQKLQLLRKSPIKHRPIDRFLQDPHWGPVDTGPRIAPSFGFRFYALRLFL